MSDLEPRNGPQRQRPSHNGGGNGGNGGDPSFNWKALLLLAMAAALIGGAFLYRNPAGPVREVPYSTFHAAVVNKWVDTTKPLDLVSEVGGMNDYL